MSIQRFYGAKLYFNTLVPWGEGKIKYGVIDRWERKYIESSSQRSQFRKDLLLDLMDWQTLYTAGRSSPKHDHYLHLYHDRLHKPVNILEKKDEDKELEEALRSNLNSALHAALLLLPGSFTEILCRDFLGA